jgi:peptidyl-prolyl cis-trans isomerase A (cyclophilin A)
MHDLLTSDLCGWPSGKITIIEDARQPGDLHYQLIQLFHHITDVSLFYFVGHGLIDEEDQLCLGLVESADASHLRAATSLEFRVVRDALIRSRAETSILILDCCFAGLANKRKNTLGVSDIVDQAGGAGAYTMAACQAYGTASFDADGPDPQTYFTKHLVDLIRTGIPGEPADLRLNAIFRHLSQALVEAGHPLPMERNIGAGGEFRFAYNAAPVQAHIDIPATLQQMNARLARVEANAAALAVSAGRDPASTAEQGQDRLHAGPDQGAVVSSDDVGQGSVGEHPAYIRALRAKAADLLRIGAGDAFRAVEAELLGMGASARPTAVLQTSMGPITIRLFPDYAPEAVRNFIELAEGSRAWTDPRHPKPFRWGARLYDGTLFHRVVRGLLIQGGDPLGTGTGGPGYQMAVELHRELTFDQPYMVAMANSGSSSNGSQFFITVCPAPWLTGRHTIFGVVIDNAQVADHISKVATDAKERPVEDVVLQSVHITRT